MIHLIIAGACAVLLLYIAALYESTGLAVLAFFLTGMLLSSFAVLVWRMTSLDVDLTIPMTMTESGRPVGVRFTICAKRPMLGRTRLRIRIAGRQLPGKKRDRTWIDVYAPSLGEEHVRREVTMNCSGGYEYRLLCMRVYDWTGWFYLTKRLHCSATTQLLPKVHVLPVQLSGAVRGFLGEAEIYDDLRGGTDTSQLFQIRSYQPGDRLQNIHWKLSAKSEELMVREHSQPKGCAIVLLLGTKGKQKQTPEQHDRFLQIAASVSFSMVDAGCPHIVSWYDDATGDLVRMRVDDEEGFYEWQLLYFTAQVKGTDVDVEARYAKKYASEACLHYLRVEPVMEVWLDGICWHSFSKKTDLEKELGGLQLYL